MSHHVVLQLDGCTHKMSLRSVREQRGREGGCSFAWGASVSDLRRARCMCVWPHAYAAFSWHGCTGVSIFVTVGLCVHVRDWASVCVKECVCGGVYRQATMHS